MRYQVHDNAASCLGRYYIKEFTALVKGFWVKIGENLCYTSVSIIFY